MQIFHCACREVVFFENTQCVKCSRELGYSVELGLVTALEPAEQPGAFRALAERDPTQRYLKCQNYTQENVCNWLVRSGDASAFCVACRLNQTIPDLSVPENRVYWAKIEAAKRRLVYSLLRLGLPLSSKVEDAEEGLAFAFLANPAPIEGNAEAPRVMTGHASGLITINIAEADEIEREQVRRDMNEAYRTLLGHFRHESGHYYWDRLIQGTRFHAPFRKLFGDETTDYVESLQRHYAQPANVDWPASFISSYAASHPWEDWAETWAHYLHMVDTLETARAFGISSGEQGEELIDRQLFAWGPARGKDRVSGTMHTLLREWVWLSLALNSLSRSMGKRDLYPFVLSHPVAAKLPVRS